MTTVHFICRGNVLRSRLAEALLAAHMVPGVRVSSSGLDAVADLNGPISWQAERILSEHNLLRFASPHWQQTSQALLDSADVVVFMSRDTYEEARERLRLKAGHIIVWDVLDLWQRAGAKHPMKPNFLPAARSQQLSDDIFSEIRAKVDNLAEQLAQHQ